MPVCTTHHKLRPRAAPPHQPGGSVARHAQRVVCATASAGMLVLLQTAATTCALNKAAAAEAGAHPPTAPCVTPWGAASASVARCARVGLKPPGIACTSARVLPLCPHTSLNRVHPVLPSPLRVLSADRQAAHTKVTAPLVCLQVDGRALAACHAHNHARTHARTHTQTPQTYTLTRTMYTQTRCSSS
jgi:hypothetical protein